VKLFCALWLGSLVLGAQSQPLDLLAVHQRALQAAPSLRGADAALSEAAARQLGARAEIGPQLSAQWQHGGGNAPLSHGGLQLNQPLVDLPRWRQWQAEGQRLQASTLLRSDAEQTLRARSAALFVQLQAARATQRVQAALLDAYRQEAQRMQVRHREGLAAAVDWRQSESFMLLSQAQARGGVQQERALRQALVAHAGAPDLAEAALRTLQPLALPAQTPATEGNAPRWRAQAHEREAREAELRASQAALLPTLALQAQAQRYDRGQRRLSHDWQLQLRIPLWDSGSRRANEQAARSRVQSAQAELELLARELAREQATQTERLAAASEQHATAQQGLAGAQLAVQAMRIGQEQGSRSTGDVLLAIQTEGQLRLLAVQAQLNAWLAWIDALTAQGQFNEEAMLRLNAALE